MANAPKSKSPPKPKPKIDTSTIIIYVIISVLVLVGCAVLGGTLDCAMDKSGVVSFSKMGESYQYISSHPGYVISHLIDGSSYVCKIFILGVMGLVIFFLYQFTMDKKRLHRRGTEHGSAKWGDKKEMEGLADPGKPSFTPARINGKLSYDKKGNLNGIQIDNNILLSKELFLSLNAKQHLLNFNVLIIGGSGSGKTRFYAKPNIMQLNTSYVITDPKGEILMSCGNMLQAAGYDVRVFNLIQVEHSNNYNPFHYVYDENGQVSQDNVYKMVNVLFSSMKKDGEKEDFWSKKGQSMLQAIIFLLFEESEYNAKRDENNMVIPETRDESHLNFFSVAEKLRKLQYPPSGGQTPDGYFLTRGKDEKEEEFEARRKKAFLCPLDLDFLELEKRNPDSLAIRMYKDVRNAPAETGQSFLSSANVNTFLFNLENLKNLTCTDDIHLETLGDKKTALFIILSATDSSYNFMAAMMYTQLFDTLANRANFVHGGTLPVHVRCIMDEFANIGQIPDFDKVIAFVRSMGMSLNVIIQNIAQLKARYEKTWEVITGNCDTTIFLGGKEESTLKSISEQLGKETIDVKGTNRTRGRQSSTSENNSILGRELMQPNELSTMPISDCIVMLRSHNPFYCTKYPIEKHPNYKWLADSGELLPPFDLSELQSIKLDDFMKEQEEKKKRQEEEERKRQEEEEKKKKEKEKGEKSYNGNPTSSVEEVDKDGEKAEKEPEHDNESGDEQRKWPYHYRCDKVRLVDEPVAKEDEKEPDDDNGSWKKHDMSLSEDELNSLTSGTFCGVDTNHVITFSADPAKPKTKKEDVQDDDEGEDASKPKVMAEFLDAKFGSCSKETVPVPPPDEVDGIEMGTSSTTTNYASIQSSKTGLSDQDADDLDPASLDDDLASRDAYEEAIGYY